MSMVPYLLCADVAAEADWLAKTFGFTVHHRGENGEGRVIHAELTAGDAALMLGDPGPDYRNPAAVGHTTQMQLVTVDDVDAHYEKAVAEGANIIDELADRAYGRSYGVADPEGHQWYFAASPS